MTHQGQVLERGGGADEVEHLQASEKVDLKPSGTLWNRAGDFRPAEIRWDRQLQSYDVGEDF